MDNEQKNSDGLRHLNKMALLLGALSIPISIIIGFYAYTISRDVLIQTHFKNNLEMAMLLGEYLEQPETLSNEHIFTQSLDNFWQKMEEQNPGSYLCLIGNDGTLLAHTERPQMVGQNVGDNHIQPKQQTSPSNLRDLIKAKESWVGFYTSLAGEKQITAFAYLPNRENLLAVHIPFEHIADQVQDITIPWIIGVGGIIVILFPMTFRLLHRASVSSQKQLAEANINLQREIKERLQAEQNLEDAHTLLEQTFGSLEDGIFVLDETRKIRTCNQSVERIFGYTPEELLGQETDILHTDKKSFEKFGIDLQKALGEKNYATFEYRMKRKDGSIFPTEHSINKFKTDIDSKNYTVSVVRDISERKKMQTALTEGEERFRQLAEHIQEVFWLSDPSKNQMFYISPGYEKIWGRSCASLYESPRNWMESIHPDDRARIMEAAQTDQVKGDYEVEYRIIRPDGTIRLIRDRAFPIKNESGEIYRIAGIAEDITDQRKTEHEQIRIQRINALGELSAGISHNLNNILSGVLGPAQLLKLNTKDPKSIQEIDTILTSSKRARDLVHRLHQSTRGLDDEKIRPIDLNKIIEDAIKSTQPRWKDEAESNGVSIRIDTQLEPILPIRATESTSFDMLVNLIFNAVDAMPQGGAITIQTRQDEDHTVLTFSDTGMGMDAQTKDRIFEPFFTTKVDVGTGLGLCTVYNSVIKWGGQIDVESELNIGTTFTFQLPNATPQNIQMETDVALDQKRAGNILIIEDDKQIRRFLNRYLSHYHKVTSFRNGRDALKEFSSGNYDVAIIDLGLSEMPGDQISQQLKAQDPLLATILITGWELAPNDARLSSFDFKMQKPFDDLIAILDIINQAIDLHDTRQKESQHT